MTKLPSIEERIIYVKNLCSLSILSLLISQIIQLTFPTPATAQLPSINTALAHQYFQEAEVIWDKDNGKLWGVSLEGPMIFADPATRMVVANQADLEGNLSMQDSVFVGKLPDEINIANTAINWAGVKWTMIIWPLPEDKFNRGQLMAHELFHRIQDKLGVPMSNPSNSHLDTREGGIWLQLEWRALETALRHKGKERCKAVEDLLIFRHYRQSLFPNAASEESALEMNEGLASYTGVKLSGRLDSNLPNYTAKRLEEAKNNESFVRSFAYSSGPAYGILLDESGIDWRKNLKPEDDLGVILQKSFSIKLPENIKEEAEKRSKNYDGDALQASETARENNRKKRIAEYRVRLVDGPILVIPLREMNVQFDPNNLQPLDDLGTVYLTMRLTDLWGILTVTNGALMSSTWTKIQVPAPGDPDARPLQGDGWTLELNAGWKLEPGEREGDYLLNKGE